MNTPKQYYFGKSSFLGVQTATAFMVTPGLSWDKVMVLMSLFLMMRKEMKEWMKEWMSEWTLQTSENITVFKGMGCYWPHAEESLWSTINKSSEREIGVPSGDSKNKMARHWLLPRPQSAVAILPPGISEWGWDWELSPPVLYSSLVLGLKACTTWFL